MNLPFTRSLLLFILPLVLSADAHEIRSADDVDALLRTPESVGKPFDLTGQVLALAAGNPPRIVLSSDGFHCIFSVINLTSEPTVCRSGDRIRVRGYVSSSQPPSIEREIAAEFHHLLSCTNLAVLGHGSLPETLPTDTLRINDGTSDYHFVQVSGVVTSVTRDDTNAAWNWIVLTTISGDIRAAMTEHDWPFQRLLGILDAEVTLRGVAMPFFSWRAFLGHHLILFGENGIELTREAEDPFTASEAHEKMPSPHRQRVRGTVVGRSLEKFFLRDADGHFIPVTPAVGYAFPTLSDEVEVSGFVRKGPIGIQLTEAAVRTSVQRFEPDVKPNPIDPETMFTTASGSRIVDSRLYGSLIRLRGKVSNSTDGIRLDRRIILQCGQRAFSIDVAHLLNDLPGNLRTACEIDVTGICIPEYDTDITNFVFPKFKGFVLIPRTGPDIVVTRGQPLWTPARLGLVIALLLLIICVILIWNRSLKSLSEHRGRTLFDERMHSAAAELKTEERTRLAVELHDSISQTLTGVALQIDAAQGSERSNPTAAAKFLENARAMLASCRQELRCCIWDLKSRTFEEKDMTEALQKTLGPHLNETKLQVRFNVPRSVLTESSAHDTLRIVRELVINAIRHGHAKNIRIAGECRNAIVRFSVKDDGCGFSEVDVPGPSQGHFGLQGIRERIGNSNGLMEIESTPGKGTKVTVSFLADEKDEDET